MAINPPVAAPEAAPDPVVARANRIRHARELVTTNRHEFCDRHDINYHTLQSWEIDRGATYKIKVSAFCRALAREGVVCTEDWLIDGIGPAACKVSGSQQVVYYSPFTARRLKDKPAHIFELLAHEEISFFQVNCHKKGLETRVVHLLDKAMSPDFDQGEFVGAIMFSPDEAATFHQGICLVETLPHHFIIRQLLVEEGKYILVPSDRAYPTLSLDKITSVGEIIWRRQGTSHRFPQEPENSGKGKPGKVMP